MHTFIGQHTSDFETPTGHRSTIQATTDPGNSSTNHPTPGYSSTSLGAILGSSISLTILAILTTVIFVVSAVTCRYCLLHYNKAKEERLCPEEEEEEEVGEEHVYEEVRGWGN
jgi:Na+-transporting methylmalonyl-CoA/oxaloacetate decarboxylase gamma subunit